MGISTGVFAVAPVLGKFLHMQRCGSSFAANQFPLPGALQWVSAMTGGSSRLWLQLLATIFKSQSHSLLSGKPLPWPRPVCMVQAQHTAALSLLPLPPQAMPALAPAPSSNEQCLELLLATALTTAWPKIMLPLSAVAHMQPLSAVPGMLLHTCHLDPTCPG